MLKPTKERNTKTSKPSTSRKVTQFLEGTVHDDFNKKENVIKKSKIPSLNTSEESLLFKRNVRRKKTDFESNDLGKMKKETESLVNESFHCSNNSLNNDIFLASTQEGSNCTVINSQGSLDQLKLANWGLPRQILNRYESRGIKSMFPWQVECLSNERIIRENRNLVYSAPTSAGKTLVAEILVLKTVLERKKKVIFILPFVSVVREKMFYFQDLLSDSGVRVEGFMGSVVPAGGFQSVDIAIATIEKANSLINRLLEEENLMSIGAVVIDELHLLGDPNRGYILELLLTKLRYISLKYEEINIQLIGMSATLPNLSKLADWLNAELYKTDFRPVPLDEQCKIDSAIYNRELQLIRELPVLPEIINDTENIIQLCIETIKGGHSVLIFCPTKNWCEKLALQTASAFLNIGRSNSHLGQVLQNALDASAIFETLEQLKRTPTGLDCVLRNTVSFGVAFHHAGLTIDERDIIEGSFRTGSLKVLVATSTLSTGVNLPARRVIIRSPCFHGKPLDTLSYHQMIGRAGRMGKDTAGESILISKSNERAIAKTLLTASLEPIQSCLEDSGPLMRSLLEAIASDIVCTPEDLDCYIKCTFINLQEEGEGSICGAVKEAVQFLVTNEFLLLQETEEEHLKRWSATPLGKACLAASVPPKEGLFLFEELLKARQSIALDTELHVVYLVTPYNLGSQIGQIDWMNYLEMWSKLSEPEKRVAKLVGVEERFLLTAVRGGIPPGKNLNIHKRFYTSLALFDLVREIPLHKVCKKFGCGRGLLQSLQQSSSTYAGMITSFCKQLNWSCMELLVAQFQTRLQFGVSRDLMDLLRLPSLNGLRARSLYKEGITTIVELAVANELEVERALHKALPFESEKEHNGEGQFELARQNKVRTTFITGKDGLTTREAAALLIREARIFLQNELGISDVQWEQQTEKQPTISSNTSHHNSPKIAENSEIKRLESNSIISGSANVEIANKSNENQTQNLTKSLSSTLSYKKFNKIKKSNSTTRHKQELTIERTSTFLKVQDNVCQAEIHQEEKVSQNVQINETEIQQGEKNSQTGLDIGNEDLFSERETSNYQLDPLVFSGSSVPTSQRSVYENIDKEVESALEEVLANTVLFEGSFESQNMFDSEISMNDCSALEQNVIGSLRLSDFEMTVFTKKRSIESNRECNNQEIAKVPKISDDALPNENFNSFLNSDSNLPLKRPSEEASNSKMNENIGEIDLEVTFFDDVEFNSVLETNKVDSNQEKIDELSGIRLSDFECTAPEIKDSRPNVSREKNLDNIPEMSEIRLSDFELTKNEIPAEKNSNLKQLPLETQPSVSDVSNVCESKGILKKTKTKDLAKKSQTSKRVEDKRTLRKAKEISLTNCLSGVNISDFELTNTNIIAKDKINVNESKKPFSETTKNKEMEFFSGINISDFELSKMPSNVTRRKENTKGISNKENPKVLSNKENLQISDNKLTRLKSNENNLEIKKTQVSQSLKKKTENVSFWEQDSWDNVLENKKVSRKEKEKESNKKEIVLQKKKTVLKDSNRENLIGKRRFSAVGDSPISSVVEKKRISIDSDSDDMFVLPKRTKLADKKVINPNVETIQSKNVSKTDFCKPGPSKIELKHSRRNSGGKLMRASLASQSSFESFVFSDEESSVENSIDEGIPYDVKLKLNSDFKNWKPANVISSKKMLNVLKQKIAKRTDIALALDCEKITLSKMIIGAKILGDENIEKNKKARSEKFIHGDKRICGVAISWGFDAVYYISLSNVPEMKISLKERVNFLVELLTKSSISVRCFLARKVYKLLYQCCGIIPSCKFIDPTVADWYLNSEEKDKNMDYLITKYFPVALNYYENRSIIVENDQCVENDSTKEAVLIWYISDVLLKKLQQESDVLLKTFKDVEMQMLLVLSRMELRGLGINLPALQELSDVIKNEMSLSEKRAFDLAGKKFNFMSSSGVSQILGLRKGKRVTTNKAVLEQCDHPIAKFIMSWRKLNTLQSLVVIPLLKEAQNSRIFGSHITHTLTGRISMQEPNLQNIPKDFSSVDNKFVISIRMAFIPTVGNIILSADYCQLELRILAHFSNDSVLRSIMKKEGVDIFKSISAKWNNVEENMVDDNMRQRTKQLCYGIIYGMGTKSLAESLSVTEAEAKEFLETFMRAYRGVRSWLPSIVAQARVDGFVTTITNRCRMLPGIWSESRSEKSQAERQAVNTKIQGSAADIAKKAMVTIDRKLQEEFPTSPIIFPVTQSKRKLRSSGSGTEFRGAYLVLQLHDELIFEVNANDLQHVARLVKESMENAFLLEVPLPVKLKVGPAWGDLKEYNV